MRFKPTGCLIGFAATAYAATVMATAYYNFRTPTLNEEQPAFGSMLVWQGLIYAIWIPVAAWIWQLFRQRGLEPAAIVR